MNKPIPSEHDKLQSLYQQAKQPHKMPAALKRRLITECEARDKKPAAWRSWWQLSQLVMGCAAMLLLLSWMQWSPSADLYQIELAASADYQQVQYHRLVEPRAMLISQVGREERLQQLWQRQQEQLQQASSMHTRMAQLQQQEANWQLTICDELQLNLSKELVAQLQLGQSIQSYRGTQWVELELAANGQVLAIRATEQVLHCPHTKAGRRPIIRALAVAG
ncbi:hypothetical protein [Alkalimonas amylolytica]|uniref:Uncharacterized protein n=1 Tax=Alkalimonas amylolytica TaxID=152573 RepID=A0A1H4CGT7_ALKAM|nr:hypothetical protein [Alkalimonas amylolytica]SEA59578.1 hypothetical protein SAMN04488051_104154 [Alkalimonas amylolytica]